MILHAMVVMIMIMIVGVIAFVQDFGFSQLRYSMG